MKKILLVLVSVMMVISFSACQKSGEINKPQIPETSGEQEEKMIHTIPIIDMVKTGQNIMNLRVAAGLSVKDLQDIFGFATPQAIYKWQHGTTLPTIDNLVVLAAVFHVHMDEILVLDDVVQVPISA